ncbi:hypothetical protein IU450_36325 [Nocardia abscessus]|uniref:hypothetical protein n=1 Tax=Nocardia abscessus TaxID=120957 RepID=UPI0018947A6D|nr:hypothetical protein [Nocardia abscessus]MBF6341310.1 hypothetical protein [Nocardia abscessus]
MTTPRLHGRDLLLPYDLLKRAAGYTLTDDHLARAVDALPHSTLLDVLADTFGQFLTDADRRALGDDIDPYAGRTPTHRHTGPALTLDDTLLEQQLAHTSIRIPASAEWSRAWCSAAADLISELGWSELITITGVEHIEDPAAHLLYAATGPELGEDADGLSVWVEIAGMHGVRLGTVDYFAGTADGQGPTFRDNTGAPNPQSADAGSMLRGILADINTQLDWHNHLLNPSAPRLT